MGPFTYGAITNASICIAIATAIYITGSAWPLIGLVFLLTVKRNEHEEEENADS